MLERSLLSRVETALEEFPVVGLLGPRQVGKTTLARELADRRGAAHARYLDLETAADLARLADPADYFDAQEGRLVILDEIHRVPELFAVLRGVVDRRRRRGARVGQFLVLGSASLDLLRQSSESLAGRIAFLELTPVHVGEVAADRKTVDRLWLRGGFPDSLLARSDAASLAWRTAFIRTYLERDIPQFGPRVPAETLRRFWTMLAHGQGQQLNAARVASGLGVSGQTVARYLDLLVDLLLVRRLEPWAGNLGKRLVRSPKIYVRDSGLVHALLKIDSTEDLFGHPVAGPSWEGMVIETLIAAAGDASVHYYRTAAGAEVDLVFEGRGRKRYAIEIKRSTTLAVRKGFWTGCADIKAAESIVTYLGDEPIPLGGNVRALGLRDTITWVRERVGNGN